MASEIKTDKFVEFTSQLKIGLSSVGKIYFVYGILENAKTCLYGSKSAAVFETIFYGTLNKHPAFQQRYKMIHK